MARSQMQKLKIVYLMRIFYRLSDEQNPLTLREILDALAEYGIEAERKSLYDDIQALEQYGLDIRRVKRNRTFYYYLANRTFSAPELRLLADAVLSARFLTEEKSGELVQKLSLMMNEREAKTMRRQVTVRGRAKTMNRQVVENVDLLHEAIAENVQIAFDYCDWNEKKELALRKNGKKTRISPQRLLWDNESYYLVAYDGEKRAVRHYRVDKMQRLVKLAEAREGGEAPTADSGVEYSERYFEMFDGDPETVTLRVKRELLGTMLDRFGAGIAVREADGAYEIRLHIAVSNVLLGWLLGLGDGVEILRPQSVADRLLTLAGGAVRRQARRRVKNIIFDLGMVLVNVRWREYMQELGFSEEEIGFFSEHVLFGGTWKRMDEGTLTQEQAAAAFQEAYPQHREAIRLFFEDLTELVHPFPDAADWIREYRERGYRVYVLTNYPDRMFSLHLETQFPFLKEADGVLVSAREKMLKPQPEIYRLLLERFGLMAEECVFLDDSKANVRGAEAEGIHGILADDRARAKRELDDFLSGCGAHTASRP